MLRYLSFYAHFYFWLTISGHPSDPVPCVCFHSYHVMFVKVREHDLFCGSTKCINDETAFFHVLI